MKLKKPTTKTLVLVVIVGLVFLLFYLYFYYNRSKLQVNHNIQTGLIVPDLNPKEVNSQTNPPSYGLPISLKIPIINVDATIDNVGINLDGLMAAPKSPASVAWYQLGTRPGEIGNAVMAGHFGIWENGEKSVFNNLNKLRLGDKIIVVDEFGTLISFLVRESKIYDSNSDATEVFSSTDGKSHLNLITCQGTWDNASSSYSKRLVVFSDKE